jgi:hypothetical protein
LPTTAALAATIALLTTVSRGGWAALLMAALVCAAALPQAMRRDSAGGRTARVMARSLFAVLFALFLAWAVAAAVLPKRAVAEAPETPWEAALQTVDPRESLETVLKRRHILWGAALDLAVAHPIAGAGLGQVPRFLATFPGSDGPENAHNYFLQVLAESGVLGLAALTLLLVAIFVAIVRPGPSRSGWQARFAVGLLLGVLAFVLTWLTGHPLLNLSNQLWLAAVLAVGLTALDVAPDAAVDPRAEIGDGVGAWARPAWFLAIAAATFLVEAPRIVEAARSHDPNASRAAGVYAWETGPASEAAPAEPRFRWTRRRAALREPVHGSILTIPVYVARPVPATLYVTIGGVDLPPVTLSRTEWQTLTYDVAALLGHERPGLETITVEFVVDPVFVPASAGASDDTRELGVGLGLVGWHN